MREQAFVCAREGKTEPIQRRSDATCYSVIHGVARAVSECFRSCSLKIKVMPSCYLRFSLLLSWKCISWSFLILARSFFHCSSVIADHGFSSFFMVSVLPP